MRIKRPRPLHRTLLYAAIPTMLALLIIEGVFRLYALVHDADALRRYHELLVQRRAFASKPWLSREYVASLMSREASFFTPPRTQLVLPKDYQDRFFTIHDGIRRTVGFDPAGVVQSGRPRRLFVLGGSTTYCEEVPDEFTWASQLQKRLAAIRETSDIEVVNCGIPAAVSVEEVQRLEYEISRNNTPDFCIFLNGINDANQGVVNGNPGHSVHETARTYGNQGLFRALRVIAKFSVAARTIYQSILSSQRRNEPPSPRSAADVEKLAQTVADVYERAMLHAQQICTQYHIRMIVFLQPHVFTIARPWTADEREAAGRVRKDYVEALRVCYPLLREKLKLLRQRGIAAHDISDAFDGNLEPIFVDSLFHVESTGNRLVAEAILNRALPVLNQSASPPAVVQPAAPRKGDDRRGRVVAVPAPADEALRRGVRGAPRDHRRLGLYQAKMPGRVEKGGRL
jgi:hypothetical protein